jgi:alpha-N-arabinofuranosidase
MMQHCADHMDLISEHFYCRERPDLVAHVMQIPRNVRHKAETHRDYRRRFDSLKGKDIRVALDEWNYWYGAHVYGELGTRYFLKDALGIAAGLNECIRQSDMIFMANYAQTVNVIGCIKTTKTAAAFAATGLPLKLYRAQFGTIPVKVTAPEPLDVAAAWTADRRALTIAIVNPTMKPLAVPLDIRGVNLAGTGRRWQIAGIDPRAYNEPGKPARVKIEQSPLTGVKDRLSIVPCSVTLCRLEAAGEGR